VSTGASARLAHLSGMATPVHRQTRCHSSSKYGLDPIITMSQHATQLGVTVQTLHGLPSHLFSGAMSFSQPRRLCRR
jgi:hypothetical protein